MKLTQTDKAITLDCGCNVDIIITAYSVSNLAVQSTLSLCPLHAAADDLLAALKAIDATLSTRRTGKAMEALTIARAAVNKAENPITS